MYQNFFSLQIPEVRLNIISNLDCVNQGEVIMLSQQYMGHTPFFQDW